MNLYIMRHGPAEDHASTGRDEDRALTHAGRDRVRGVAHELGKKGEAPERIVSSPLVRALQTATIVSAAAKRPAPTETRIELVPGGDTRRLVRELVDEGASSVMLVGHEPELSSLARQLAGAAVLYGLQKAMVIGIRVEPDGTSELRFVLDPTTLEWSPSQPV